MKVTRKIITIDETLCDGCGLCIPACPEQAIQLVETPEGPKARLVKEVYCDGLGACLGNCPTGALVIETREADPYDDEATIKHIKEVAPEMLQKHQHHLEEHADEMVASTPPPRFSCPSAQAFQWESPSDIQKKVESSASPARSELRQWPVQLHLVSPNAPYFKHAEIVFAADCVPFAHPDFQQEFLKGKALAVGCPKFDDVQVYLQKIAQILTIAQPVSITIVKMEVPCCSGLARLVQQAMTIAGSNVPLKTFTVSIKGTTLP